MITEYDRYNYVLNRGFLKRIKEAIEEGIYPDMERGEKLVERLESEMKIFEEKDEISQSK
tara:strand:+ start:932 stop:1111 length:180 start_codon:yes stop_codon:yes gene_type:complete